MERQQTLLVVSDSTFLEDAINHFVMIFLIFLGNINDTIADIFGRPGSSTVPPISGNSGVDGATPVAGSCTCVPYYLCNNGSVNNNGEGIIDIRYASFAQIFLKSKQKLYERVAITEINTLQNKRRTM